MWNPFKKHEDEHDDINWYLTQLTYAVDNLNVSVKELREEVDYLVDFLDD